MGTVGTGLRLAGRALAVRSNGDGDGTPAPGARSGGESGYASAGSADITAGALVMLAVTIVRTRWFLAWFVLTMILGRLLPQAWPMTSLELILALTGVAAVTMFRADRQRELEARLAVTRQRAEYEGRQAGRQALLDELAARAARDAAEREAAERAAAEARAAMTVTATVKDTPGRDVEAPALPSVPCRHTVHLGSREHHGVEELDGRTVLVVGRVAKHAECGVASTPGSLFCDQHQEVWHR